MGLLDTDIRNIIGSVVPAAVGMYDITITRRKDGTYSEGQYVGGATETFVGQGMVDTYSDYAIANGLAKLSDRKVLIIQTTLATVPKVGDVLTARGQSLTVLSVDQDPAQATWDIRAEI